MLSKFSVTIASVTWAAFVLVGCSTPANLDLSLDKQSTAGLFHVTLLPPTQTPAINQLHSWKVKLTTPEGIAITNATFTVGGGMPQHGHGFPTQPRITRELEEGTYLLEGMKFSMTGWWEIKLDIQGPKISDKVVFNTVIANLPARQ
ncbi:FixH family protein [Polaromonas sp. CG_9.11]|uniref:FixH family protein n=1 Tax=Polaromonas sp. CG_9.11 TaxID=2787730 RepID=UPI0018CAA5B7|nr:FixH family protein [Polaromonas sp. CG_9.11]MBG6078097.1 hypothetical protein [Polaromonas sp. CG_9.11]